MKRRSESVRRLDREIFRLALPALATLISEPLLLLADSAIVGHLGTDQLAGLAIAANLLGILTGLCIFLAYGTTGTVARRLGAGDHEGAMAGGFDGLALALILGIALSALLELLLLPVVGAYGASPTVTQAALAYLRIAALGLPSILILLAGTGRAARAAGHEDPALRGDRRQRDQHRTQPRAGLRSRARHRRLSVGDLDCADRRGRGARRGHLDAGRAEPGPAGGSGREACSRPPGPVCGWCCGRRPCRPASP